MAGVITIEAKGDFSKTKQFLNKITKGGYLEHVANKYGAMGVSALAAATPVDTGRTANSWYYEVEATPDGLTISWNNRNRGKAKAPIALMLQYGHGTGTGGYVVGRDYINPALRSIFDDMAVAAWKEVTG